MKKQESTIQLKLIAYVDVDLVTASTEVDDPDILDRRILEIVDGGPFFDAKATRPGAKSWEVSALVGENVPGVEVKDMDVSVTNQALEVMGWRIKRITEEN